MRWTPPAAIVANTDPHSQPGSHWVAMYLDNDGHCVYFDSYGVPPGIPQHLNRIRKNSRSYTWNTRHLQSFGSKVCGQYCIMFLHYMARGYTLQQFCKMFSNNQDHNDRIVARFHQRICGIRRKNKIINNNNIHNGSGKLVIQSCRPKFIRMY